MEDILANERERLYQLVMDTIYQALHEGIKANTILINSNMVKVKPFYFEGRSIPTMFCGMNLYVTKDELPDGYSFAIFENEHRSDRLAEFEAIGMEPSELKKAAEVYRTIKEKFDGHSY